VVPVPAGATTGNVVVTVGGLASNGVTFTVAPKITTLSPTSGPVATSVTITGTTFGATQGTSTVTFNGTAATPTSWSATSIVVPVPAGATTTGNVVVTVGGLASNGVTFTVAPQITTLSPTSGPVATSVTITGTTFGATQATSTVTFNGTAATPTSWSATSIVVPVPAGATTGNVVVTVGGLASNSVTFTVNRPPTLITPADQVSGANTTVSLQLVGNDPDGRTLTYSATGLPPALTINAATGLIAGTLSPTSAGSYTVTATAADAILSTSKTFNWTVYPATMSATPATVAPGGTLTVTWQGIPTPTATDWFALFPLGAPDSGYETWWRTTGAASDTILVTLPTSVPTGDYELRLFAQNGSQRLAVSNGFTVTSPGPILSVSPAVVASGGTLTVTWQGIVSPTTIDWFALFPAGAADGGYLTWWRTTGTASDSSLVTLPASLPAGAYELRLFEQNTFVRLAVSNGFTVTGPGPILSVSPAIVAPGGTLTAAWQGIASPTATDWFGLFPVSASDMGYVAWWYTTGTASDSSLVTLPASLPAGAYELRLFAQNGTQRMARSNAITVTSPGPALTVSPPLAAPGSTISVSWQGIVAPTASDWFALFPASASDMGYVAWWYTTGTATDSSLVTLPASLAAGNYELRLFAQNGMQRLARSNALVVTSPGPTLGTSPTTVAPGGTLTIAWQGIVAPTATDWIALLPTNASDTGYVAWWWTTGTAAGSRVVTLSPSLPVGTYELRLFAQNTSLRLARSNAFVVTGGPILAVDLATVAAGGTLMVTWQGIAPPTATDWFALVPTSASDTGYVAWWYTSGTAVGSRVITVPASLAPGTYELRLFANGSSQRLARSNASVVY